MRDKDIIGMGVSFKEFIKDQEIVYRWKKKGYGGVAYYQIEKWIKVLFYILNWYWSKPKGSVFFMSSQRITENLNNMGCSIKLKGVQYAIRVCTKEGLLLPRTAPKDEKVNGLNHTREIHVCWKKIYDLLGVCHDEQINSFVPKSRMRKVVRKRPFTSVRARRLSWERLLAERKTKSSSPEALFDNFLRKIACKYHSTESYNGVSENPDQTKYMIRQSNKPYILKLNKGVYKLLVDGCKNTAEVSSADIHEYNRFGIVTIGNAFVFHLQDIMNKFTTNENSTAYYALIDEIKGQAQC